MKTCSNVPNSTRPRRTTVEFGWTRKGQRTIIFRGSEFGGCYHSHIACLRGMKQAPVDAFLAPIFAEGHSSEARQKALLATLPGLTLLQDACGWEDQQKVVVFGDSPWGMVQIQCSPDGLLRVTDPQALARAHPQIEVSWAVGSGPDSPRLFALENKCLGKDGWRKFQKHQLAAFPLYEWQTSAVVAGYRREHQEPVGLCMMLEHRCPPETPDSERRYLLHFTEQPRYRKDQCIARCVDILRVYQSGEWRECDSSYACRYPHSPIAMADEAIDILVSEFAAQWQAVEHQRRALEYAVIGRTLPAVIGGHRVYRDGGGGLVAVRDAE